MTDLIACFTSGKGALAHVLKVIDGEKWDTIYLITTEESKTLIPNLDMIYPMTIDTTLALPELISQIKSYLKDKVRIMDTAVNIISGEGKEHMALLSALLQLGVGIRFVALTKEGVREI